MADEVGNDNKCAKMTIASGAWKPEQCKKLLGLVCKTPIGKYISKLTETIMFHQTQIRYIYSKFWIAPLHYVSHAFPCDAMYNLTSFLALEEVELRRPICISVVLHVLEQNAFSSHMIFYVFAVATTVKASEATTTETSTVTSTEAKSSEYSTVQVTESGTLNVLSVIRSHVFLGKICNHFAFSFLTQRTLPTRY